MKGQVRLLKCAGGSSKNLFFTTTLQNSVQSFSLRHNKLQDPYDTHPSPPSVFALSCTSHLLLSTSASPPTIHLRNLKLNTPPILLRPRCSSSAVVATDFHPDRPDVFLLAFEDGTVAVYDSTHMFRNNGTGGTVERTAGSGTGGEIGCIKGLHAISNSTSRSTDKRIHPNTHGPSRDNVGIGSKCSTVTAATLVSGRKATAVTVGADGKCCVVDFTQPNSKKAILMKSWHLRRPATSLSVVYSTHSRAPRQTDGTDEEMLSKRPIPANKDYVIAVGRLDGKVLLFDLGGQPLGQKNLDPQGARVVDVEWAKSEIEAAFAERKASQSIVDSAAFAEERASQPTLESLNGSNKRKSLGTIAIKQEDPMRVRGKMVPSEGIDQPTAHPSDVPNPQKSLGVTELETPSSKTSVSSMTMTSTPSEDAYSKRDSGPAINHLDLTKTDASPLISHPTSEVDPSLTHRHNAVEAAVHKKPVPVPQKTGQEQQETKEPGKIPLKDRLPPLGYLPPPVPPRPTPKEGGRLSMRRAETARSSTRSNFQRDVAQIARRVSAGNPRFAKGLKEWPTAKKGPKRDVPVDARPPSMSLQSDPMKPGPLQPNANVEASRRSTKCSIDYSSHAAESSNRAPAPPPPSQANLKQTATNVSPVSSNRSVGSFQTAPSEISDTSNDTVVDWSGPTSRRPVPTILEHPFVSGPPSPLLKRPTVNEPRSPFTKRPTNSEGSKKNNEHRTLTSPSTAGESSPFVGRPKIIEISSKKEKADSSETLSPTSDETVIQWPPLVKSPRISELNKLLDPKGRDSLGNERGRLDSATEFMLTGGDYLPTPAPEPQPETDVALAPKARNDPEAGEGHTCQCTPHIERTVKASLEAFKMEIRQQFEAQRVWIRELLEVNEEENRMMRLEVARMGKRPA